MRFTFRTKLLLAMMTVVAGVTIVMLIIAQKRVQANYERMFRTQYERQVGYFTALQEARLGTIKEQCLKLVQSVRLLAMMNEDPINSELLYDTAEGELRSVLRDLQDPVRTARGQFASFYRFVDAKGAVIPEPDKVGTRRLPLAMRRRLEQRLGFLREALDFGEIQNVAYLPVVLRTNQPNAGKPGGLQARALAQKGNGNGGNEPSTLQEIIVTRIVDSQENKNLGALVLAFPLPDLVPQPMDHTGVVITNTLEMIQAGILIDDRLFANAASISESLGDFVAGQITQRIKKGEAIQGDFSADHGKVPYRIHYEVLNENSKFPKAYQVCLYSLAEAQAEQRLLRWKVLGLGAGAILIALGMSLFLAHGLSAPIRSLVVGTGEIERGNFQVRVPVHSQDELGQLANSFNEMAEGLAQKERYRTVLNMVQDEEVAHKLMSGEIRLGGELKDVTVLLCDIRGFTALTQNMPPGEVIELINEHMTALTRVVKQHQGVLDKFVGDLLMVVFGAPLSRGDDAGNAARCALELVRIREEMNETSRYRIRIGVGLATGTVVAGCMGSPGRLNYTVLGERVNLASRLCGRAAAGEVLIDEGTREKLGPSFIVEATGEVELKGFALPVAAYRLSSARPEAVA